VTHPVRHIDPRDLAPFEALRRAQAAAWATLTELWDDCPGAAEALSRVEADAAAALVAMERALEARQAAGPYAPPAERRAA
jgi:hypothetical protein